MSKRRARGVAIATAMLVLVVTTVIVFAIASVGIHNLNLTKADLRGKKALYAAEAGAQAALEELNTTHDWKAGFPKTSFGTQAGVSYEVSVTDNFTGTSAKTAPNGASVPAGAKYILSTGRSEEGGTTVQTRQVGFLIRKSTNGAFNWAIASGNNVTFKANADIFGGVKSSGDIVFEAKATIVPVEGEGRVLASKNVKVKSNISMDSTQDVRAREDIDGKIMGTTLIYDQDETDDTLPFIADGRTENKKGGGEGGEVLPNPNVAKLLASGTYTDHGGTTTISSGTFDLGGGVHYFPKGITFKGGAKIAGEGTIVVGNGNAAVFEIPLGSGSAHLPMNVIAIDGKDGTVGGSSIKFTAATRLQGLVYSHDDITSEAFLSVKGSVISYKPGGGDFVHTGASLDVVLEPMKVSVPGFEEWLGGGSSSGKVDILSWQRS